MHAVLEADAFRRAHHDGELFLFFLRSRAADDEDLLLEWGGAVPAQATR